MTRDERNALRATSPDPAGLQRIGAELGGEVIATHVLTGGISASVHAIVLRTPPGEAREFVLKRYIPSDPMPALEWERLGFSARTSVPVPAAVAFDPAGAWFGIPALVMSRLPGTANYAVANLDTWCREIARVLAAIHATALPGVLPAAIAQPHPWLSWTREPTGDSRVDAVARAIAAFRDRAATLPQVFSHRDFHPQNVLWDGDTPTGVIDWTSAGLSARGLDVATCRIACAIYPGGDAPDRFLAHYCDLTGEALEDMPNWDLVAALECLEDGLNWATAVRHLGDGAISGEAIILAAEEIADAALSRLA